MGKDTEICPICNLSAEEETVDCGPWLQCDACPQWYHSGCLDLRQVETIDRFYCPRCVETHGPTTFKPEQRKSSRSHAQLNYKDVNEGLAAGDLRIYSKLLAVKKFKEDTFKRYRAKDVTMDMLRSNGLKEPLVIEENEPELEMKMPAADIAIHEIAELVGKDVPVDVIDVASQSEITGWTLSRWADYYHSSERDRIRNVISLEISDTNLAKQIVRPKIVRDLDWIDQMWPETESEYPKVQLYCLMGTKDSYTDFHIDFGGSSVFYHILRGSKKFYFIEPTDKNLKKYQKWSSSSEQSTTFLGDLVKDCYCVELKPGNTMIIPTGWIHAVFTPEDALVIGGNFLHTFNVATQLKVHEIEEATAVPLKFRFPFYKKINWYALSKYEQLLLENNSNYSNYELESIVLLARFLREEVVNSNLTLGANGMITSSAKKSHQIPECIQDPITLTKHVEELAKKGLISKIDPLKKKESDQAKQRPIIRLTLNAKKPLPTPPPPPEEPTLDDHDYEDDEEDHEEDWNIEEEFEEDDDEYQEDPDAPVEYNTIPAENENDHSIKKEKRTRQKRKRTTSAAESKRAIDSSDDEDMGTSRRKATKLSSNRTSSRKRSLSNNSNSSQPSSTAKQRILGMINNKRY